MKKPKDKSTLYAIAVTGIIALLVAGSKFINKFNFESNVEPNEYVELTTEPLLDEVALENYEVLADESANPLIRYFEDDGKYASNIDLLYNQPVADRLEFLIGSSRLHQMRHYWKIDTPIYIQDGIFIAKGCAQRNCDDTNFVVMMDIANDKIFAGVKIEGVTEVFAENSSNIIPLEQWRSQNNGNDIVHIASSRSFIVSPNFSALSSYYNDISNKNYNINRYFTADVGQFQNLENISPELISQILSNQGSDTRTQKFFLDTSSLEFSQTVNDIHYYSYLIRLECYRISKKRNEESEVRMQVGFNQNGLIVSLKEIRTESMIYTN